MIIKIAYFIVYFIEMLISYIFFNHIGCRKKSAALTLAIGTVLFELGAVVGLFNIDSALLNAFFSLSANVVFAIVFFDVKKLQGIFYSFILVVLSSFLELVSIFTISTFADIYILNYESQPMLLVIEVIISKIIYFLLIGILIKFVHPSPNSTSVRTPSSFYAYPISTFISVIFFWYIAANESRAADLGGNKPSAVYGFDFHFLCFSVQRQKGHRDSFAPAGKRKAENRHALLQYARKAKQ